MKNLLHTFIFTLFTITSFATVHQISAGMYYFYPASLTIEVGDTVVWYNDGGIHDVNGDINSITGESFENPESFSSSATNIVGAEIYTHVFNTPGSYNYDCSVGNHALQGMMGYILVEQINPLINWIDASSASQGESLSVTISGTNMDYENCYDQWSDTYCYYSSFQLVFDDYSSSYSIYGQIYDVISPYAYANINIPENAPIGNYHVQIYDYNTFNWVSLDNSFEVIENCSENLYSNLTSNTWVWNFHDCNDFSSTTALYYADYNENGYVYLDEQNTGQEFVLDWNISSCNLNMDYDESPYNAIYDNESQSFVSTDNFQCYNIYADNSPHIISLFPNNGYQDESLSVTISGSNIDFENCFNDWSDTYCEYSNFQLVFDDYSDSYFIYGNIYNSNPNTAYANIYIPENAPTGIYEAQIFDLSSSAWVTYEDAMYIYPSNDGSPIINWIESNSADQGEDLYVTISGTNMDFENCYDQWSDTYCDYSSFQLVFDDYSDSYSIYGDIYSANSNYAYASVSIPQSAPLGYYDVLVYDYNTYNWVTLDNAFYVSQNNNPIINWIESNSADQGEDLYVTISGTNMDFENCYNQWSDTYCDYSSFQLVFDDYSDSYSIYGDIYSANSNYAYASVSIPQSAPLGYYDVLVYDYNTYNWVTLDNAFYVIQSNSNQNSFCTGSDAFYCEDFESVIIPSLPYEMSTSSMESNYYIPSDYGNIQVNGFYTGDIEDAGVNGYWTYLPEHTTFAMTNDDACSPGGSLPTNTNHCDLSFEVLELPELDFSAQNGLWLQFDFFHDQNWGGGNASVEISLNEGMSWMDISGPLPATQTTWQSSAIDLSDYSYFSSVKIRFVWSDNGSWASGFAVDNIIIDQISEDNLILVEAFQTVPGFITGQNSYPTIPLTQVQSVGYSFNGVVQNMGLNSLNNVVLNASVAVESFYTQSNSTSLNFMDSETLQGQDVFYPPQTGEWTAQIIAFDEVNSNSYTESVEVSFNVSDYEYALDNSDFTDGYTASSSINANGSQARGNIFEIYSDATLYSIKVRIHPSTSPEAYAKGMLFEVYGDNDNVEFLYFTETPEINVGEINDGWVDLVFDNPVEVFAGQAIFAAIQSEYNGVDTLFIGNSGVSLPRKSFLQDIDGVQVGGNPGDWYYLTNTPMVRLNFDPNVQGADSFDCDDISYQLSFIEQPSSTSACDAVVQITDFNVPPYSTIYINNDYYDIDYLENNYIYDVCFGDVDVEIFSEECYFYDFHASSVDPSYLNYIESNNAAQGESLNVTISGTNVDFENCYINDWSETSCDYSWFYLNQIDEWSNSYQIFGNIFSVDDNTAYAEITIPVDAPTGYYDVVVQNTNILYDGFFVSQNINPCDNWSIYFDTDVFTTNYDSENSSFKICPGVIELSAYHPYFSDDYLEWSNGMPYSSINISEDINLSLIYNSSDTVCVVEDFEFDVIENINEVADVTIISNSCFGVDDGSVVIEGLDQFSQGDDHLVFSSNQDLMPIFNSFYSTNYNLEDSISIHNTNDVSQVFVAYNYGGSMGCVIDVNFDTELSQPISYSLPFVETFDDGMACDWNNESQWTFGESSDVTGPYWGIPPHNQFAVSNDDACDCDMMEDRLITPPLIIDELEGGFLVSFSAYYTGDYGSIANIEISNDMGYSWQNMMSLSPSNEWQDLSLDISDYIEAGTIQISFRHSDSHSWGSGFAIDNVRVELQCFDDDEDGVCNEDEIFGCTDEIANNYDDSATEDDGSCQIDIYGCTYTVAINFNPEANVDDGSCYFTLSGCTDALATNYNVDADIDDGSCEYTLIDSPCDIIPSGLFVDDIIHNRVVFNWSLPSSAPSHYMIRYRVLGTNSWTVMTAGPVNSSAFIGTSRTRYFMEPSTTYEWSLRARVLNEDGSINCQSPWSTTSAYTTLDACANLENLSASTEANWVTLIADAPSQDWGVWQSKAKIREVGTNTFRYTNGDEFGDISVLKGNFEESTEYEWHTKAWCTGNVDANGASDPQYHSGWGEFSSFTTQALCDKMPTNLTTESNGAQTSITMSWSTPESGQPDHYFLELTNETTGQVWAWNNLPGTSLTKTKFGLTVGDYSWRIRGACGTNGTSWATIFSQPISYTLGGTRLDNNSLSNLDIYPNPSRDIFNVTFNSLESQTMTIKVVNMIGEEIFNQELTEFLGHYKQVIDMSKQPKGVYLLKINSTLNSYSEKVVIQ